LKNLDVLIVNKHDNILTKRCYWAGGRKHEESC